MLDPKKITVDQAMRCAKREPGRSWEAIESELNKLGELAKACLAAVLIPGDNIMAYYCLMWKLEMHARLEVM